MIDSLSKFKRLFVFGCSYTSYRWPTWADILSTAIPNSTFYNFGNIGVGNLYISLKVSEISRRFKFDKDDLVIVMWTSTTREDRYVEGKWLSPGNVYNQSLYKQDFVRDFCDPDFFFIRDTGLMNLTNTYLRSFPCTYLSLNAWPINSSDHMDSDTFHLYDQNIFSDLMGLYDANIATPEPLRFYIDNRLCKEPDLNIGHQYIKLDGRTFVDQHPNPLIYGDYLKHIGITLPDNTVEYLLTSQEKLCKITHENHFGEIFPQFHKRNSL